MKRKKFLALALAGVMTAATLTACAPLEDLYDWFFGGGSSSASRGNGTGLVESETLEESIIDWFGLTNATRKKDEAEPVLQEVAMIGLSGAEFTQILRLIPRVGSLTAG